MLQSAILFFFFNDTATTEIYTLSLHDALPISADGSAPCMFDCSTAVHGRNWRTPRTPPCTAGSHRFSVGESSQPDGSLGPRSEEHTSELQSQSNIVCRLLLAKKKTSIEYRCRC